MLEIRFNMIFNTQTKIDKWTTVYFSTAGDVRNKDAVNGLYGGKAKMTPYLHDLYLHLCDQLSYCEVLQVPLTNFSAEPVERKNYEQRSYFYAHTTMGGGLGDSPTLALMKKENRSLFQYSSIQKPEVHLYDR
jgi:hypothetical protein